MVVKILHLINNLGSGGAEKLLEDLIPLMNQMEDVEADILLLTDKKNVFYESLVQKGIKVDVIKYRKMYDPRNILEIKKYICKGKYDLVHSHIFPTQYWVALSRLIIRNKKVKFVTTEHSTHNRRREKFYFRIIDRFIYSKYDVIISVTEKTRDNLINWIDPKRKRIDKYVVIENGVDIEKIKEALPYKKTDLVSDIGDDIKLVCMVGRFSEAKDQPTLIKALSKLPLDIHLALVGEGPLKEDNKKLAKELGILDRVHFLGFREDIPRILKSVDIVVLSSHWEGFGLSAVEGMAAGKPVIVSDVEGLAEVVYGAGIVFKSEEELRNIINSLLINYDLYEKLAQMCIEKAETYNIKKMLMSFQNIYSQLCYEKVE